MPPGQADFMEAVDENMREVIIEDLPSDLEITDRLKTGMNADIEENSEAIPINLAIESTAIKKH